MQVADVGSEGKRGEETGKRDGEGKAASKGMLLSQRPPGPAAAHPTGKLGAGVEHRLNCPTRGVRLSGHFHTLVLTSHSKGLFRVAVKQMERLARDVRTDQPSVASGRAFGKEMQTQTAGNGFLG